MIDKIIGILLIIICIPILITDIIMLMISGEDLFESNIEDEWY